MAGSTARVLIVEDDAAQRHTLCDILQAEGFDAVACASGADALEQASKESFAVAVLDQRLPDLNGTQLLEQLRNLSQSLRAIIHTAYGSFESARDAVNLGAYAYVEKVGDPSDLIGEVRRAMDEAMAERVWDVDGRFRSITEYAPDPILQLERDGSISFVNHNLAGYPLRDMHGTPLADWIVEDHRGAFEEALEAVFRSADTRQVEIAIDGVSGLRHWFDCRLGPAISSQRVVRAVVVARETTRQRLRERVDRILQLLYGRARATIGDEGALSIKVSRVVLTDEFVWRNPEASIGPHTLVSVTNSGPGLSAEQLERIFEPFAGVSGDEHGAGLDLVGVYAEVARSGGHIEVESAPEEGTTFHIYLPEVG